MTFLDELHKGTNKTSLTENGAITNDSTLDPLLDFFSNAGAMRGREAEALALFQKAYAANPLGAIRCLFYLRDIRGGQGERSVFRFILGSFDADLLSKVVKWVPDYGRWDEVPITEHTVGLIKEQLAQDEQNMKAKKSVSLLAKWLPSENASSRATRRDAEKVAKLLGLKPRQYRKKLSELRAYIVLLEQRMSRNQWGEIEYPKVPSQAHKKHVKAFMRHDEKGYKEYLESVKKGEAKINAGTLYTYQLFDMVRGASDAELETANQLWAALPDYTQGKSALVVADVSGSMMGKSWGGVKRELEPISISVSLALYFAERNEGPFKDCFMTFSSNSRLLKVHGSNLRERMESIETADWDGSTNLQSAFNAILGAAKRSKATPDQMPKVLYIISDMEFDIATSRNDKTNFEMAKQKFQEAGYELPHLVFWNVDARSTQSPATKYDGNVTLISGSSQSTFRYAVEGKTPLESMMDILNSDRYTQITL